MKMTYVAPVTVIKFPILWYTGTVTNFAFSFYTSTWMKVLPGEKEKKQSNVTCELLFKNHFSK